jgi:hypothetical protein
MKPQIFFARAIPALLGAILFPAGARAEPITFRFEAEINTMFPGIPFNSGIDYAPDDVISGQFTFEPTPGNGSMLFEVTQPHLFTLNINGVELSVPTYDIHAVNNSPISDFPPASVIDSMLIGAGNLAPEQADLYPNIDPGTSSFRITLFSPADVLSQAGVPEAVVTWNEFDLTRQINVTFRNGMGGAIGFQATIGAFSVVPEPASYGMLLAFLASWWVMINTIRYHQI